MSLRDRLRRKPAKTSTTPAPASTSQPARFDPTPYTVADTAFGGGHSSPSSSCHDSGSSSSSPSCDSGGS
ncbi:hypothetical protein ABZ923_37375 [Streptomyces sp. NPDC046881]|uniref:hypothetical protein n=1 Tax=Streptomyces sp. NPDC046881 TaxID=3155374 RepID=UPI0033E3F6FA